MECFQYLQNATGDLIVNLPVGYGKSIIYHLLPQIIESNVNKPVVIVISPLNIIQKDQLTSIKQHKINACRVNIKGCIDDGDEGFLYELYSNDSNLDSIKSGEYTIILTHPEALLNTSKGRELLNDEDFQGHVIGIAIDECHIIEKWGAEFRTAYQKLGSLKSFFPNVPIIALSGTLTEKQKNDLPKQLNLQNYKIIEASPDKPNIFLSKFEKPTASDVAYSYEQIFHKECDNLYKEQEMYPVTLMFLPVYYLSQALVYLQTLFGSQTIESSIFSALCSGQDKHVIDTTIDELRKENPRIRLVLTTSIAGMGFDPKNVTRIVHTCPPRSLSQYLQEIGRAGRRGQPSEAILYFSNRDIAKNLPGITEDIILYCKNKTSCLRNNLLSVFGFTKDEPFLDKCCSFCNKESQ
ncbi:hypothetical protein SNE40_014313 [Patella caerulea]|uniref:DNA 3'-5' helicase n=1 Tax=Patella caerulea TaxID=87958 RepID=A0AAN8JJV9_PATCE